MTRLQFTFGQLSSRLWVWPTLLSLAAIAWVFLSMFADQLIPGDLPVQIERDTLVNLFSILASTMLTVATFSVSSVAAAYSAVGSSATPRATSVVMSDVGVQSTLAAFLAAFIYAVVSITALSAVSFGSGGRFMLFVGFVLLIGWVLMSFLRWVDRVSRLGKLGDTLERLTDAANAAFSDPSISGLLGGRPLTKDMADEGREVLAERFGYVQYVDMSALQEIAEDVKGEIRLKVRPGFYVSPYSAVGWVVSTQEVDESLDEKILRAITFGKERNYKTDPRYAMILLSEVADRALSPAVNDPGTAIAVIHTHLELFQAWVKNVQQNADTETEYERVCVPAISAYDLMDDAFMFIARDGAGQLEVGIRLQKAFKIISLMPNDELKRAAQAYSGQAVRLAEEALPLESQRKMLSDLAKQV